MPLLRMGMNIRVFSTSYRGMVCYKKFLIQYPFINNLNEKIMKRIAFIVVAMFVTAMAYAQPHADITSLGNNNTATIQQVAGENWAFIMQDLGMSENNTATIIQSYGNSEGNHANIFQTMIDNVAEITQGGLDNTTTINQWGIDNFAKVWQLGENSTITINQHPMSTLNTVDFRQNGINLSAVIDQYGTQNKVKLMQGGEDGDLNILQRGTGNKVVGIGGGFFNPDPYGYFMGDHLDIDQIGRENTVRLWSGVAGATVDILQNGNGNTATVYQTATPTFNAPMMVPQNPNLMGGPGFPW